MSSFGFLHKVGGVPANQNGTLKKDMATTETLGQRMLFGVAKPSCRILSLHKVAKPKQLRSFKFAHKLGNERRKMTQPSHPADFGSKSCHIHEVVHAQASRNMGLWTTDWCQSL